MNTERVHLFCNPDLLCYYWNNPRNVSLWEDSMKVRPSELFPPPQPLSPTDPRRKLPIKAGVSHKRWVAFGNTPASYSKLMRAFSTTAPSRLTTMGELIDLLAQSDTAFLNQTGVGKVTLRRLKAFLRSEHYF